MDLRDELTSLDTVEIMPSCINHRSDGSSLDFAELENFMTSVRRDHDEKRTAVMLVVCTAGIISWGCMLAYVVLWHVGICSS